MVCHTPALHLQGFLPTELHLLCTQAIIKLVKFVQAFKSTSKTWLSK